MNAPESNKMTNSDVETKFSKVAINEDATSNIRYLEILTEEYETLKIKNKERLEEKKAIKTNSKKCPRSLSKKF